MQVVTVSFACQLDRADVLVTSVCLLLTLQELDSLHHEQYPLVAISTSEELEDESVPSKTELRIVPV